MEPMLQMRSHTVRGWFPRANLSYLHLCLTGRHFILSIHDFFKWCHDFKKLILYLALLETFQSMFVLWFYICDNNMPDYAYRCSYGRNRFACIQNAWDIHQNSHLHSMGSLQIEFCAKEFYLPGRQKCMRALSSQRACRTEKEAASRKAGLSWRCLLVNTNSDPYAAVHCLPENWKVFQMDFAHLHV